MHKRDREKEKTFIKSFFVEEVQKMFGTQKRRRIKHIGCSYKVRKTILNQDSLNYQENISPLGSFTL